VHNKQSGEKVAQADSLEDAGPSHICKIKLQQTIQYQSEQNQDSGSLYDVQANRPGAEALLEAV
jgi:hypothetical protein